MVKPVTSNNIAPHGHLEDGHLIASASLVFPGVRGKLKRSITTSDGTVLKSGTKVIIQPLNRNKKEEVQKFKITPFHKDKKSERSDLPESQRDVVAEKTHEVSIEKPEDFLSFNDEHFIRSEDVLFPTANSPSLKEINQARIPDCFLLAAIQTLASRPEGKAFIRGMMRQNSDGTTTVRLYDPTTLQPHYIRVENSIIADGLGELNIHDGLWVHILEKAYAALGKNTTKQVDVSISSVYSGGGYSSMALSALTGVKTKDKYPSGPDNLHPLQIEAFIGADLLPAISINLDNPDIPVEQAINGLSILPFVSTRAICNLFNADPYDAEAKKAAQIAYIELIKCNKNNPELFKTAVEQRSAKKLRKQFPVAAQHLETIFERFKPFSGSYTLAQDTVYKELRKDLEEGRLVTAGTSSKFTTKVAGLASKHAYTVLGVEEGPVEVKEKDGTVKTITARYVVVRNPWGDLPDGFLNTLRNLGNDNVGVSYEQHRKNFNIRQVAKSEATSFVELSVFCQYFSEYTVTEPIQTVLYRDVEKEKCIKTVNEFVEKYPISFSSSNQELIDASHEYEKQAQNLLNLEYMELDNLDRDTLASLNGILDSHYDRNTEELAIVGLLDEKRFPCVSGDAEAVKKHIYAVLKLKWLETRNDANPDSKKEFLAIVKENSPQKNLWESIDQINLSIDLVLKRESLKQDKDFLFLEGLAAKVRAEMQELPKFCDPHTVTSQEKIEYTLHSILNNLYLMERVFYQIYNITLTSKMLNYSTIEFSELDKFSNLIKQCKELLEPVISTQASFKQLWDLRHDIEKRAGSLQEKRKITAEEHQEIQEANRYLFSGKLKTVGEKLLNSSDGEKKELGNKMIAANTLAKKIQSTMNAIRKFFSRVTDVVSTLFHTKNSYELPASRHTLVATFRSR